VQERCRRCILARDAMRHRCQSSTNRSTSQDLPCSGAVLVAGKAGVSRTRLTDAAAQHLFAEAENAFHYMKSVPRKISATIPFFENSFRIAKFRIQHADY
jgi:hypothetical protein